MTVATVRWADRVGRGRGMEEEGGVQRTISAYHSTAALKVGLHMRGYEDNVAHVFAAD
jgi:hypothetical protein